MEEYLYKIKQELSKDILCYILEFLKWSDWKIISCAKLSIQFIREFTDRLDWWHVNRISTTFAIQSEFKDQIYEANIFRTMDAMTICNTKPYDRKCDNSRCVNKVYRYYYSPTLNKYLCIVCWNNNVFNKIFRLKKKRRRHKWDINCLMCENVIVSKKYYISHYDIRKRNVIICTDCYPNISQLFRFHDYSKERYKFKNTYAIPFLLKKLPLNIPGKLYISDWEEAINSIIDFPPEFGSPHQWAVLDRHNLKYGSPVIVLVDCDIKTHGRIALIRWHGSGYRNRIVYVIHNSISEYLEYQKRY